MNKKTCIFKNTFTVHTAGGRLTVVREAGGQQVSARAAALLRQVNGHPDVLHPPLHLRRTAGRRQRRRQGGNE